MSGSLRAELHNSSLLKISVAYIIAMLIVNFSILKLAFTYFSVEKVFYEINTSF